MKAERRHELKTNTWAQGLGGLPAFWSVYGTKVLLGVVAVLAIVLFIRVQRNTALEAREQSGEAYSAAVSGITSLQNLPMTVRDPAKAADQARQIQTQVETAIAQVLDTSDDDALKAEALVARGDLNWHLSRMPGIRSGSALPVGTQPTTASAAASTRPAPVSSEADELLEKARRAYDAATRASGAKPVTIATARFGLAAIAEQRGQWEEARKAYETVRDDAGMPQPFRDEATLRLDDLKQIQKPVLIGRPATEPASDLPDVETRPATEPAIDLPDVESPSATAPVGPPVPAATKPATTATTTTRTTTTAPAKQ